MNKLKKIISDNEKILIVSGLWIVFFGSLNTKWNYSPLQYNFIELFNLLRFVLLYSLPIIIYSYFLFIKNYNFSHNIVLYSFYLYSFCQLLGFANFYFFNPDLFEEILNKEFLATNGYNLRFSYSFFTGISLILPIPLIALIINDKDYVRNIFYLSIIILIIITIIYSTRILYEWINYDNKSYLYWLPYLTWGTLLDMPAPRSTGISRWYLILFLTLLSYFVTQKSRFNYKIFFLLIFLGAVIYLFQSRTSFYFLILSTLILFFKNQSFLKNLFSIIFLLTFIVLTSKGIVKLKLSYSVYSINKDYKFLQNSISDLEDKSKKDEKYKADIDNSKKQIKELEAKINNVQNIKENTRNFGHGGNFSTGRLEIWADLSEYIFKSKLSNFIFGYGSQADRYLVTQNASNGLFYILITSGFLGLLFFIIIYLKLLNIIINLFNSRSDIKKGKLFKFYHLSSLLLILFFSSRMLVENSITIYGLDYLFFLLSFAALFNLNLDIKNNLYKK